MNLFDKFSFILKDSFIKNSYILISDGIFTTLLGFIYWILATRLYGSSDIGIGNSAVSAISLVVSLSVQGFGVGIVRLVPQYPDKENQVINSCLTLSLMLLSLILSIFYIFLPFWSKSLNFFINGKFLFFVLFSFSYLYTLLLDCVFIAKRETQNLLVKNLQLNTIKLFLLLGFIFQKSNGIYYSWGISIVITCIIETLIFRKKINNSYKPALVFDKKLDKEVLEYSMKNHISDVLSSLPNIILPIMIVELINANMAAYFTITWMIMNSLMIIEKSTSQSLFAEISTNISELDFMVKKSIKFLLSQLSPLLFAILLFGRYILDIYGKEYSLNGYPLLVILTISLIPYSLNTTYFVILRAKKELSTLQLYTFFLTTTILILSYFMTIKWNLIGTGIAWLSAQLLCFLIISPKLKKILKGS
jgi:Membrane protein involved in the export of O-antigen and teichoic acid